MDVVLRARRVVTPSGEAPRSVGVEAGRIVAVDAYDAPSPADHVITLEDDVVLMPGLVDTHVHVNEPGRTAWEGFPSATRAAAAGGITTIVDMPLNSVPPTTDVVALDLKRKCAEGNAFVDVGFWGGVVPGNLGELRALHDAGVFGFKCFLAPSGVDEFPQLNASELERALHEIHEFDGLLLVHAEDAGTLERSPEPHGRMYREFLSSRPRRAEDVAVVTVLDLAARTGCRVHLLHLSSTDEVPRLAAARGSGVPVSVETCPHYLVFVAEEIGEGATQYKCCPPIREAVNREELWRGLADGVIDAVVSDHSPCPADLKQFDTGDFDAAWGGIASLQVGLPAMWTQASRRGYTVSDLARWMAESPARLAGLTDRGSIEVGRQADFCVFAPDEAFVVDQAKLWHKCPLTPYDGLALAGVVRSTWLRGEPIEVDGVPRGRLLVRGAS
ncbi:allantoinase [Kribbella amoyensis]|uniref:allantoinase n=1 Tax=Kribbella amoyensis TaxID=996641 RepID=A0A561B2Q1_9ACTN|nr:allantoinase AllB [Kribbella amoyensis]TWD73137.1 allantoinase [Kribbella amoyensis]